MGTLGNPQPGEMENKMSERGSLPCQSGLQWPTPVMAAESQPGCVKINNSSCFFEPALHCSWLALLLVGDVTSI